jgi:hypothetical protein
VSLRVGAIQSAYIPWRGYFDFIASVDLFVVYDDVQFSKNSWRNRNQLKTARGLEWITIPVHGSTGLAIDQVEIADPSFVGRHRGQIRASLSSAPYFQQAMELWERSIGHRVEAGERNLSRINYSFIKDACGVLGVSTPLVSAREFQLTGRRNERLLDLMRKTGATTYLSGPAAGEYLDHGAFAQAGVRIEYKSYEYEPYPQRNGAFEGAVSILDLIANTGEQAPRLVRGRVGGLI